MQDNTFTTYLYTLNAGCHFPFEQFQQAHTKQQKKRLR